MQEAFDDAGFTWPESHNWPPHEVPAGHPPPETLPEDWWLTPDRMTSGVAALRTDTRLLLMDDRVRCPAERDCLGILTFLCLDAPDTGEQTIWVPLTARPGKNRLPVEQSWRLGGNYRWRNADLYLLDTQRLWVGPRASFAHAGWRDAFNDFREQAHLSAFGLGHVRSYIEASAGRQVHGDELPW
jgi:hypothetical protein